MLFSKRITELERKMDKLLMYVPRLYSLLVKARPAYPCKEFKQAVCTKCNNTQCANNPNTSVLVTAESIMEDFIRSAND